MEAQYHQLKNDLLDLLHNLAQRIDSIVNLFESSNVNEGYERLIFLAEDVTVVAQTASLLRANYSNLDIEELNHKLNMLFEHMETGDFLFISDILMYELKPLFEYWSEQLQDA